MKCLEGKVKKILAQVLNQRNVSQRTYQIYYQDYADQAKYSGIGEVIIVVSVSILFLRSSRKTFGGSRNRTQDLSVQNIL